MRLIAPVLVALTVLWTAATALPPRSYRLTWTLASPAGRAKSQPDEIFHHEFADFRQAAMARDVWVQCIIAAHLPNPPWDGVVEIQARAGDGGRSARERVVASQRPGRPCGWDRPTQPESCDLPIPWWTTHDGL